MVSFHPDTPEMRQERAWALEYQASVAMRYHARRRAFLRNLSRLEPIMTLIVGSSAFITAAGAFSGDSDWLVYLTLGVVVLTVISIVFDFSGRSYEHDALFRRWAQFRASLTTLDVHDDRRLTEMEAAKLSIDAETPHTIQALAVICQNEENEFRRAPARYHVSALQKIFSNIFTFPFARFEEIQQ